MELSLLPLDFGPSLTVASRLLPPFSIEDKTLGLLVKQFSTAGNSQRHSQSYIEKRGGRREIEEGSQEEKRGATSEESNLASNLIHRCSPQSGTPREFHRVV